MALRDMKITDHCYRKCTWSCEFNHYGLHAINDIAVSQIDHYRFRVFSLFTFVVLEANMIIMLKFLYRLPYFFPCTGVVLSSSKP